MMTINSRSLCWNVFLSSTNVHIIVLILIFFVKWNVPIFYVRQFKRMRNKLAHIFTRKSYSNCWMMIDCSAFTLFWQYNRSHYSRRRHALRTHCHCIFPRKPCRRRRCWLPTRTWRRAAEMPATECRILYSAFSPTSTDVHRILQWRTKQHGRSIAHKCQR